MSEESIIGKFFGVLGFKVDHKGAEEFQASLGHLKHAVEAVFAVELIHRTVEFVERSIGAAAAVNDLAEITDMTATKIDALGRVAVDNSSSVEAMREAILGVYRATGQAAMGLGRNVKLFQALGLHAKDSSGHVKDAETMMGEMADKFQSMDMAKVVATAGRLGIDPMIAKAMKEMGGEGWRAAVSEALGKGLLSDADYEQADRTEKTFKRFHFVVGQLATLVANQLAPWLRRAVNEIEKFFVGNKVRLTERLQAGMRNLSTALTAVWHVAENVWHVLEKTYEFFMKNERAAQALRAVIAAIVVVKVAEFVQGIVKSVEAFGAAARGALGPWALIVGGAVLLVQDWLAFKDGEESVFKDLSEKWPGAMAAINKAMETMLALWEGVVGAARELGILSKAEPKKGTVGWYVKMKENPPMAGSKDYADFMEAKAQMDELERYNQNLVWEGGQEWQMLIDKAEAASNIANAWASAVRNIGKESPVGAGNDDLYGRTSPLAVGVGTVLDDRRRVGEGTVLNITGTKVEIKADTPERAERAGVSARDAMSSQQIRNYQPRGM